MDRVKQRLGLVRALTAGSLTTGDAGADGELAALQLRKALEQVAFAALAANKSRYSQVHDQFQQEWNAKKILQKLRKLHPEFYPVPLVAPVQPEPHHWHFERHAEDYLTQDEFVFLYDRCSSIIHDWNPYRIEPHVVHFERPLSEWVARLERLLGWHSIQLYGRPERIVVEFSGPGGPARVYTAQPAG